MAVVKRMNRTVEQQLQGPRLEAIAAFNRERRLLVGGVSASASSGMCCSCVHRCLLI